MAQSGDAGNFNPRSPHGERQDSASTINKWAHFNPRSPHGERPQRPCVPESPHHFNPRSPHGERHHPMKVLSCGPKFQSTLPARGATRSTCDTCVAIAISIHAPRTGSDRRADPYIICTIHFNPRSPHGERLSARNYASCKAGFQSTLPARGATEYDAMTDEQRSISIHAPRTGSDDGLGGCLRFAKISIHAPRTGSDVAGTKREHGQTISIHAPRTGSDLFLITT